MADKQPSPREQAQNKLVEFLESRSSIFTAPYGVLPGLDKLPRGGKVRSVTFGVARYLDATASIFNLDNIQVRGEGAFAEKVEGKFNSVEEFISHLQKQFFLTQEG